VIATARPARRRRPRSPVFLDEQWHGPDAIWRRGGPEDLRAPRGAHRPSPVVTTVGSGPAVSIPPSQRQTSQTASRPRGQMAAEARCKKRKSLLRTPSSWWFWPPSWWGRSSWFPPRQADGRVDDHSSAPVTSTTAAGAATTTTPTTAPVTTTTVAAANAAARRRPTRWHRRRVPGHTSATANNLVTTEVTPP